MLRIKSSILGMLTKCLPLSYIPNPFPNFNKEEYSPRSNILDSKRRKTNQRDRKEFYSFCTIESWPRGTISLAKIWATVLSTLKPVLDTAFLTFHQDSVTSSLKWSCEPNRIRFNQGDYVKDAIDHGGERGKRSPLQAQCLNLLDKWCVK